MGGFSIDITLWKFTSGNINLFSVRFCTQKIMQQSPDDNILGRQRKIKMLVKKMMVVEKVI